MSQHDHAVSDGEKLLWLHLKVDDVVVDNLYYLANHGGSSIVPSAERQNLLTRLRPLNPGSQHSQRAGRVAIPQRLVKVLDDANILNASGFHNQVLSCLVIPFTGIPEAAAGFMAVITTGSRLLLPNPCHETFTSTVFVFAFSLLGRCTFNTPSLNSALTFAPSAPGGSVKLRRKFP